MSSFVGTGVGETVVLIAAVDIGPTNRFQRSSTSRVSAEVNAVGFATAEPLNVVDGGAGVITGDAEGVPF